MIQYTSGTTSFPKGCMLAHLQVIDDVLAMGKNMAVDSGDRIYCPLPFNHVGGSLITLLMGLLAGATVVTAEHFEPEAALSIVQREKCTVMNGVETIWLEMLKHPRFDRYDLETLEKGWAIGPPELLRNVAKKCGSGGSSTHMACPSRPPTQVRRKQMTLSSSRSNGTGSRIQAPR